MEDREILRTLLRADEYEILGMLFRYKLIPNEQLCAYCSINMKIKSNIKHIDKFEWRCMNYNCSKYQTTLSLRTNSCFSAFKIDMKLILEVIFYISNDFQSYKILEITSIKNDSLIKIKKIIQDRIKIYFENNPVRLGGPRSIVQVDETKLNYNVKNHRGRSIQPCWALCIVDTSYSPALGYCTLVENRSADTLLGIISDIVVPGSIICTDEWKAYLGLRNSSDFEHRTVCHKYNFINPIDNTHTQHVESYDNRLKLKIKAMKGLTNVQRKKFLLDFMFRERHRTLRFYYFIKLYSI